MAPPRVPPHLPGPQPHPRLSLYPLSCTQRVWGEEVLSVPSGAAEGWGTQSGEDPSPAPSARGRETCVSCRSTCSRLPRVSSSLGLLHVSILWGSAKGHGQGDHWPGSLAAHGNHLDVLKKYWCPGLTPGESYLINLGADWPSGFIKACQEIATCSQV